MAAAEQQDQQQQQAVVQEAEDQQQTDDLQQVDQQKHQEPVQKKHSKWSPTLLVIPPYRKRVRVSGAAVPPAEINFSNPADFESRYTQLYSFSQQQQDKIKVIEGNSNHLFARLNNTFEETKELKYLYGRANYAAGWHEWQARIFERYNKDKVQEVTDLRQDVLSLIEQVGDLSREASIKEAEIDNHKDRIAGLEGLVDELYSDIDTHEEQYNALLDDLDDADEVNQHNVDLIHQLNSQVFRLQQQLALYQQQQAPAEEFQPGTPRA